MDLTVLWVLDEQAGEKLTELHRRYAIPSGQEPGYFAHLSLGVYQDAPLDKLKEYTEQFARRCSSFSFVYDRVVMLSDTVIAALPGKTEQLQKLHHEFHQKFDEYADVWTALSGGRYFPHSTLLCIKNGNVRSYFDTVNVGFEPFRATVKAIAISRAYADARFELAAYYPLDAGRAVKISSDCSS